MVWEPDLELRSHRVVRGNLMMPAVVCRIVRSMRPAFEKPGSVPWSFLLLLLFVVNPESGLGAISGSVYGALTEQPASYLLEKRPEANSILHSAFRRVVS